MVNVKLDCFYDYEIWIEMDCLYSKDKCEIWTISNMNKTITSNSYIELATNYMYILSQISSFLGTKQPKKIDP